LPAAIDIQAAAMRFFFYGTLLAGSDNPAATHLHARLTPLGPARARGALYAIADPQGWFPAMVEHAPGQDEAVHGMIYETAPGFGPEDLVLMDSYEDCDPLAPEASLYLRREIAVTMADGSALNAQAYVWNRPLPADARRIDGGDFRCWLSDQGLTAFGGSRSA